MATTGNYPFTVVLLSLVVTLTSSYNHGRQGPDRHFAEENRNSSGRVPGDSRNDVYMHSADVANMSIYSQDSQITRYINMRFANEKALASQSCKVKTIVPNMDAEVKDVFRGEVKLLEYIFYFRNQSDNPLLVNRNWTYKTDIWNRVAHSHGQTILDLAFNYGVLSLMTLSFGVFEMEIELEDQPHGCMRALNETERIRVMLNLLLRDLDDDGHVRVYEGEGVCHQIIKNESNFAKFTDQCCFKKRTTGEIICTMDIPNMWLSILDSLLIIFMVAVLLFGPFICTKVFYAQTLDTHHYTVSLKEPLHKTVCITRNPVEDTSYWYDHIIDMRTKNTYCKGRAIASKLPEDKVIPIKLDEFNINVNYARLLPENEVPVGVLTCLSKAVFFCKMREVQAIGDCCEANVFGMLRYNEPYPWSNLCYFVGRLLLVLCLPLPYYIRLVLYYVFEDEEVRQRLLAANKLGLPMWWEYRMLHYLTPTHPGLIAVYILYFATGFTVACVSSVNHGSQFKDIIIKSLRDLLSVSSLDAVEMVVRNFLWPFRKMGLFGFVFGLLYWPVVMPLCIVTSLCYCIPLLFVSGRLMTHSLKLSSQEDTRKPNILPGEIKLLPTAMQLMEADTLLGALTVRHVVNNRVTKRLAEMGLVRVLQNVSMALVCIATLMAIMVLFTECLTYVLQVCIFTMMGIIVNAGKVLKYGTLIFLVVLYSYDCYNNVYKQYLKLNKALFSEIKGRVKDIMEVTSLPSYLQKNMGFKAVEASEQAEHESTDDLNKDEPNTLTINDLIIFIDNDDVPRIPSKLFDEVCQIQVPGSPGPVYLSLLTATGKFFFILMFLGFVFIVVLSFGEVYRMSGTNQMLATMAGGFMPFIFSYILKPANPDTELGSVSFKSKLEEVIINFWQRWPLYDFPFDLDDKEAPNSDNGSGSDSDMDDRPKDKDKKKSGKKGSFKKGSVKSDKSFKKDKKDGGGGKHNAYGSKGSMTCISDDETIVNEKYLEGKLEELHPLRPAGGASVDILILLPPVDEDDLLDLPPEVRHTFEGIPLANGGVKTV